MNNDVFIEYLVKKRKTTVTYLTQVGIVVAGLVVILLCFALTPYLGSLSILSTLAIVGAIYGVYFLLTGVNVEYEYILTNGELDVDKIVAQRKRSRLITLRCRDIETFGRYNPQAPISRDFQTRHIVCDDVSSENVYYFTLHHATQGHTLVVLNLNEKLAQNLKLYVPRSVLGSALDR